MEDLNAILGSLGIDDNIYDRLYQILGCGPQHTLQQITYEYKQLALKYHPDRNPSDPLAEKRFREIKLAHDILGDPRERACYDHWLRSSLQVPYLLWRTSRSTMHWTRATSLPSIQDTRKTDAAASHDPHQRPSSPTSARDYFLAKFRSYKI